MLALLLVLATIAKTNAHLRVCYYSNWSQYRNSPGKFFPENVDPHLCTHLVYSFANLDSSYQLTTWEWNDPDLYARFNGLKAQNPGLKTLLAVGGWTAGSAPFSTLSGSSALRKNFASTSATFLRTYGFDGLDMDWEYPALRGGVPDDKNNFILLLRDLKKEFEREQKSSGLPRLLLTAAVAAGKSNVDTAYDIPGMEMYLDFINLMAYDLHGGWEKFTGHQAQLFGLNAEDQFNVDWAARYWRDNLTSPDKLIIGLATYGRSFTLANPSNNGMGAPAIGSGGAAGPYTGAVGFMAYYEVCLKLSRNEGTRKWHRKSKVPYLVDGNQWIGYDDEQSITAKLRYIRDNNYGGAMVWNIDLDDFNMMCPLSTRRYPLMSLMKEILDEPSTTTSQPGTTQTPASSTGGTTKDASTEGTTDLNTKTPTKPPTTGPTGPPGSEFCSGRADGLYPDPKDCSKFYQCDKGTTYHRTCAPNLVFNPNYNYCDHTYNYDCETATTENPVTTENPTTETPTTDPPTTEAPTTEPPTTEAPTTEPPTTEAPTTEPPTTEAPTTEPPTTEAPTTEPPTTEAPTTEPPTTEAPTTEPPTTGAPTTEPPTTEAPTTEPQTTESPTTEPPTTEAPITEPPTTEAPTTDPPTTEAPTTEPPATQPPSTTTPGEPDPNFCANEEDGMYKVVEDCSKYYICAGGYTYIYTCSVGTLYSPSINNCDWEKNVDCSDTGSEIEFCDDKADGHYWYPDDCSKYYSCGSGITYIYSCPAGTVFDSNVSNCGWKGSVDCKGAPEY